MMIYLLTSLVVSHPPDPNQKQPHAARFLRPARPSSLYYTFLCSDLSCGALCVFILNHHRAALSCLLFSFPVAFTYTPRVRLRFLLKVFLGGADVASSLRACIQTLNAHFDTLRAHLDYRPSKPRHRLLSMRFYFPSPWGVPRKYNDGTSCMNANDITNTPEFRKKKRKKKVFCVNNSFLLNSH